MEGNDSILTLPARTPLDFINRDGTNLQTFRSQSVHRLLELPKWLGLINVMAVGSSRSLRLVSVPATVNYILGSACLAAKLSVGDHQHFVSASRPCRRAH